MKKLVKESLVEENSKLNENTTDSFVVDKNSKRLLSMKGNSYDYWQGDKKGTIDMEIEVFAFNNHEKEAQIIYDALKKAGLTDRYFSVEIHVK